MAITTPALTITEVATSFGIEIIGSASHQLISRLTRELYRRMKEYYAESQSRHSTLHHNGKQWLKKGEGNANELYYCTGHDPLLAGKVLRLKKRRGPRILPDGLEREVWSDVIEITDSHSWEEEYISKVLRPLLGSKFVSPQAEVQLSPKLVASLKGTEVQKGLLEDNLQVLAYILPDCTLLPQSPSPSDDIHQAFLTKHPVLCAEIKPKCGFLPTAATIHPRHQGKERIPRYHLHQHLKLLQGRVEMVSEYNPLDLFSGEFERCKKAITNLMSNPQNNFRGFLDSHPVEISRLAEEFRTVSDGPKHMQSAEELAELLASMLRDSGVLEKVLAVQKLDEWDIEGVHSLYTRLRGADGGRNQAAAAESQPPGRTGAPGNEDPRMRSYKSAMRHLAHLPRGEALRIIRNYLVACSAKDCSVMIAFRRLPAHVSSACDTVEQRGVIWEYRVKVVDLDLKPLSKIEQHYLLDQQILDANF